MWLGDFIWFSAFKVLVHGCGGAGNSTDSPIMDDHGGIAGVGSNNDTEQCAIQHAGIRCCAVRARTIGVIDNTGFQIKSIIIAAHVFIGYYGSIDAGEPNGFCAKESLGAAVVAIGRTKGIVPEIFHDNEFLFDDRNYNILGNGILGKVEILSTYCELVLFCQRSESLFINVGVENLPGAEVQHTFGIHDAAIEAGDCQGITAVKGIIEGEGKLFQSFALGFRTSTAFALCFTFFGNGSRFNCFPFTPCVTGGLDAIGVCITAGAGKGCNAVLFTSDCGGYF